jgi:uncharacterized protein (TIGR03083 family)
MSKPHGTKEFWLAGLRADAAAFRSAVRNAETLSARVPTCPEWTLLDLVRHLGNVYAEVAEHAPRGVTTRPEKPAAVSEPSDGPAAMNWWDEQYRAVHSVLESLDPELPAWNWAPQAKKAGFWHRRMAHETAVHRWDAQVTAGLTEPIEAKLAADGITEVLDSWLPAGRRRGPKDMRGIIALHGTDVGEVWYVRLRGEGIALLDTDTLLDDTHPHERATAAGTASDVMLALYGRVPFEVLEITGEPRLLEALRTG